MRLNLKLKFVVVATFISMVSIFLVSKYMSTVFTHQYWGLFSNSNRQILDQLSQNLNLYLDEIYRLTLMPYYNKDVMNELKTKPISIAERLKKRRLIEEFLTETMVFPRKDIQQVCILSDALYFSDRPGSQLPTYNEALKSMWYREIINAGKPLIVLPDNNSHYFSITNIIWDLIDNTTILGVVKVDADYTTIRNICKNANMGLSGGVMILDNQDQIVYSSFDPEKSRFVIEDIKKVFADNISLKETIYSQNYLYNIATLNRFNWQMVMANSLDSIKDRYAYNSRIILFSVVVGIVIASILMYLLMQYLLNPLFSIIKLMKKIEGGNLKVRYEGKTDDEINRLGTTMNNYA